MIRRQHLRCGVGVASAGGTRLVSATTPEDGTVWAWGLNTFGQLGFPNEEGRILQSLAHQIPDLNNVRDVAAGDSFALAIKSDGTVWAWGLNDHGQLGAPSSDKCNPNSSTAATNPSRLKTSQATPRSLSAAPMHWHSPRRDPCPLWGIDLRPASTGQPRLGVR
jgi:alpha-tubulin suppressor-like RCC1 family protein